MISIFVGGIKIIISPYDMVENIVGKGENACYQQLFPKVFFLSSFKGGPSDLRTKVLQKY